MPSPGKGKAKENPARARKVARKERTATLAKVTEKRHQNTRASRHKAADCWYKQQHKPQGKGKSKTKSKVTEISESDNSKQVEETWTRNPSSQPSSLSQVNTIGESGCVDEGLWVFSLVDSKKRRHTVSWGGRKSVSDLRSG